jgi:hypothetical protein
MSNVRIASALSLVLLAACASTKPVNNTASNTKGSEMLEAPKMAHDVEIENAYLITRGAEKKIADHALVFVRPAGVHVTALSSETGELMQFDLASGEYISTSVDAKAQVGAKLLANNGRDIYVLDQSKQRLQVWLQRQSLLLHTSVPIKLSGEPLSMVIGKAPVSGSPRVFVLVKKDNENRIDILDIEVAGSADDAKISITAGQGKSVVVPVSTAQSTGAVEFDPLRDELLVGLGTEVFSLDPEGVIKPTAVTIKADVAISGLAVMPCESGVQQGYIFAAGNGANGATVSVFDRATHAGVGSFKISDVKQIADISFSESPRGYFPNGALLATANGDAVAGVSWEKVATALGVRKRCF